MAGALLRPRRLARTLVPCRSVVRPCEYGGTLLCTIAHCFVPSDRFGISPWLTLGGSFWDRGSFAVLSPSFSSLSVSTFRSEFDCAALGTSDFGCSYSLAATVCDLRMPSPLVLRLSLGPSNLKVSGSCWTLSWVSSPVSLFSHLSLSFPILSVM